jgi:hypothetical protein
MKRFLGLCFALALITSTSAPHTESEVIPFGDPPIHIGP